MGSLLEKTSTFGRLLADFTITCNDILTSLAPGITFRSEEGTPSSFPVAVSSTAKSVQHTGSAGASGGGGQCVACMIFTARSVKFKHVLAFNFLSIRYEMPGFFNYSCMKST